MKSPYTDSLAHTTYECKYHIVFTIWIVNIFLQNFIRILFYIHYDLSNLMNYNYFNFI